MRGVADTARMDFFCYHRDRPDSMPLRIAMVEQHWAYMDSFASSMIARGPTFASDETLTGSLHILGLPDPASARRFAFEEPGYQAGVYSNVMLRCWSNALGRSMEDYTGGVLGQRRYLVLGYTPQPTQQAATLPDSNDIIVGGYLLSDDESWVLGAAILMEADDADTARTVLDSRGYVGVEIHQWRPGGRPA